MRLSRIRSKVGELGRAGFCRKQTANPNLLNLFGLLPSKTWVWFIPRPNSTPEPGDWKEILERAFPKVVWKNCRARISVTLSALKSPQVLIDEVGEQIYQSWEYFMGAWALANTADGVVGDYDWCICGHHYGEHREESFYCEVPGCRCLEFKGEYSEGPDEWRAPFAPTL